MTSVNDKLINMLARAGLRVRFEVEAKAAETDNQNMEKHVPD